MNLTPLLRKGQLHDRLNDEKAIVINLASLGLYIARKDSVYGFWSFFDRYTGKKLRVSPFSGFEAIEEIHEQFWNNWEQIHCLQGSIPELIDLSITSKCPYECEYCYQNSTPDGGHAELEHIREIFDVLRDLEVFEVAMGGGEPSLHPDLNEILVLAKERRIVVNFSTKNLDLLRNIHKHKLVWEKVGAIAFSVSCLSETRDFLELYLKKSKKNKVSYSNLLRKAKVHIVMCVSPLKEIMEILDLFEKNEFYSGVTLLDYKMVGRGSSQQPYSYDGLFSCLENFYEKLNDEFRLGIDTPLVQRFWDEILDSNISPYTFSPEEGAFFFM